MSVAGESSNVGIVITDGNEFPSVYPISPPCNETGNVEVNLIFIEITENGKTGYCLYNDTRAWKRPIGKNAIDMSVGGITL